MKRFDPRIVFGLLLIFGGALALANSRGWLTNTMDVFIGGAFLVVGLAFLFLLVGGHWWGAFPGFTLASIGVLILLPPQFDNFGGGIVLGGIALSFWYVYVSSRIERWWALIPAGVLTTLAVVTVAADRFGEFQSVGFFFLGLALTFLLVALLAGMRWAFWPAAVLGVMGLLGIASLLEIADYIWAVAFIAVGAFLLFRYFSNR